MVVASGRPAVGPVRTGNSAPSGRVERSSSQGWSLVPCPGVHGADAAFAAFAAADGDGVVAAVQVGFFEVAEFGDAESGAPADDDECAEAAAGGRVAGDGAEEGDDVFDAGRFGRVLAALVAGRSAVREVGVGGRGSAAAADVEDVGTLSVHGR